MEIAATGALNTSLSLPVSDQSQAGEARRLAASWARSFGVSGELSATLALVVTELATNLAIHTSGGVLLLRLLGDVASRGVEIVSLDSGPGVANFGACLRDGHSTAGTAGNGLGAVQRAASVFEVHSQAGVGTALLCEIWSKGPAKPEGNFILGAVNVPIATETRCGDAWALHEISPEHARLLVADGLGHGELAANASLLATEVLQQNSTLPLPDLLETMHGALRATRGAAVAIADIDNCRGTVQYAGIGNIAATIMAHDQTTSLVSHNGTVGAQYRSMKEFTYAWPAAASLVMHSDGMKSQWKMDRYTGLAGRHPGLIAGVLFRDFHRKNDDATVVVLRSR